MASSVGSSALWYLTRGTCAVALVLLTMSVALGVVNVRRVHTERVPRFVGEAVRRSVSLLAVAFTSVLRRAAGRPKLWQRHRHPDGSSRGETGATRGSRGMSVAVELLLPRLLLGIGARPIVPLGAHLGGEDRSAGPRG